MIFENDRRRRLKEVDLNKKRRIFLLLHIWDILQMVKQFCSKRWSLQRRIVASRSRGCVHHSQGAQRLWSLCSRAKSIKSSNRKISNCHWDYKSQITMHWDWDFVTHLKWGIWNSHISCGIVQNVLNRATMPGVVGVALSKVKERGNVQ